MMSKSDVPWLLSQTTTKAPFELLATAGDFCSFTVEVLTWNSGPTAAPAASKSRAWIERLELSFPPEL